MPTIAGLRGTGDWATDERPTNFRETILWLDPNGQAPLTALMSKMGSESVDDPQFNWWEETNGLVRIQNDATAALAGDATLTVVSGALAAVAGDLFLVEDPSGIGEIIQVSADPTTDTSLDITRGVAGTTAAGIPASAYITKIGNAFAEGTGAPTATSQNPDKLYNYCQIFKTTYDMTNTAIKTRTRTGDPLANDKKRKMFAHSRDLEFAFLFGQRHETTGSNGKPLHYTGGLRSFLSSNVTTFSGTGSAAGQWGLDNVINAFSTPFDYDGEGAGNERLALVGNGFATKLNNLVRTDTQTRINFEGQIKIWGMSLQRMVLPQGTVYWRTHPLMNIHPVFTNSAFVINPRGIIHRHLRDTNFKDNIQANDADERKGQWLTEAGVEVHFEKTMAYLGNAGGA